LARSSLLTPRSYHPRSRAAGADRPPRGRPVAAVDRRRRTRFAAIRHRWTGPIACDKPRRGIWGGPPDGGGKKPPQPALNLAFAPRGAVQLASSIHGDVPEIGLRKGVLEPAPAPAQKPK
jgi:hypothetical protein